MQYNWRVLVYVRDWTITVFPNKRQDGGGGVNFPAACLDKHIKEY